MWMWKYISVILNKFLIKIPPLSFFQKWLEDQEKIRMEQLEKLGINEDDIGVDVIKSSHKDPGVKPPGPGQPPKAPEEKGKDFNLKIFKKIFSFNNLKKISEYLVIE